MLVVATLDMQAVGNLLLLTNRLDDGYQLSIAHAMYSPTRPEGALAKSSTRQGYGVG